MRMPCFSCLALRVPFQDSSPMSKPYTCPVPMTTAHCPSESALASPAWALTSGGELAPWRMPALPGWALTAHARLLLCGVAFPPCWAPVSLTHRHPPHPAQTLTFHAGPFFCRDISAPLVCIFEYINAWGLLENKKHDGGFELTKCCLNFQERQENECYVFIKQVCHVLSLIFFDTVILFLIIYTEPSDMLQKRKRSQQIYFYNWKLKHPTIEEC